MNEISLDEILTAAYDKEFSQYDNAPEHIFSRRHNRVMKRIFKIYEKRTAHLRQKIVEQRNEKAQFRWNRKTVTAILIVIILAALAGCTAAIYYFGGFKAEPDTDNTRLFPIELENCPQVIEAVYCLPELPEGFELLETVTSDATVYTAYINNETKQTITLLQTVKEYFAPHYNTEHSTLEEITVNEHRGVGLQGTQSYVAAWDNGDYILEVCGDLSKSEVINLAKTTKILEN